MKNLFGKILLREKSSLPKWGAASAEC